MIDCEFGEQLQQFASDNYAGICPEAWRATEAANRGHVSSYGDDPWTAGASDAFRELFEKDCEIYFVFNGTAANSLALASLCQSYHGVICCDSSHVETDECGAPEFFSNGSKLLVSQSAEGKLTPASIRELATKRQDIHYPKPRVVTITQSTELGTVYTLDELRAISGECKLHNLYLHMDGARFANACASLGCSPAETSWKSGVDVLCFGGCAMPCTQTVVQNISRRKSPISQVYGLLRRLKPTRCSYHFPKRFSVLFEPAAGNFIHSSVAQRDSCFPGIPICRASIPSVAI